MKTTLMEELSNLMDGEATQTSKEALIELMIDNPEAAALWQRYHLIRAALNNQLKPGPSMVARVRSVIDKETAPWQVTQKHTDA